MSGAQLLAASGVAIDKIRILARHSGDAILRYVAEAPLRSLHADLGLPSSAPVTALHPGPPLRTIQAQVESALSQLGAHSEELHALRTVATSAPATVFVQNLATMCIHAQRPGDALHTACGWSVGPERQRRGGIRWLSSIASEPWWILCDRCLLPERRAAKLLASAAETPLSD